MTAQELITRLQELGEENLNRNVVIFDGPACGSPTKVEILKGKDWGSLEGNILID